MSSITAQSKSSLYFLTLVNAGVYRRRAAAPTLTRLHFTAIPDHPDSSSASRGMTRPHAAVFVPGWVRLMHHVPRGQSNIH